MTIFDPTDEIWAWESPRSDWLQVVELHGNCGIEAFTDGPFNPEISRLLDLALVFHEGAR